MSQTTLNGYNEGSATNKTNPMKEQPKSRESLTIDPTKAEQIAHAIQDLDLLFIEREHPPQGDIEKLVERLYNCLMPERVSGEPPKPDHTPISESEGNKDKAVKEFTEMTSKHIMTFFYLMGLKSHIESMVVNQATGEEFIFSFQTVEYFKQRNKSEVSGEAKTPDEIDEITNAGDLFGGLSGNLKRCEICYNLADKYFGEGGDEDGGIKMHAVDFAHFVIGQLKLVKELTGGSVPTPDLRKRIIEILEEGITFSGQTGDYIIHGAVDELVKLMRVPTPSDVPTEDEIIRRAFDQRLQYNLPQAWSVGYEVGAKWILEWLRASAEEKR